MFSKVKFQPDILVKFILKEKTWAWTKTWTWNVKNVYSKRDRVSGVLVDILNNR